MLRGEQVGAASFPRRLCPRSPPSPGQAACSLPGRLSVPSSWSQPGNLGVGGGSSYLLLCRPGAEISSHPFVARLCPLPWPAGGPPGSTQLCCWAVRAARPPVDTHGHGCGTWTLFTQAGAAARAGRPLLTRSPGQPGMATALPLMWVGAQPQHDVWVQQRLGGGRVPAHVEDTCLWGRGQVPWWCLI